MSLQDILNAVPRPRILSIQELKDLDDADVEAAVNARGRASNPKWDDQIMGYETFSDDQKAYLRGQARVKLGNEAA